MGLTARQLADAMQDAVGTALTETGIILVKAAKFRAPVDTGRLRGSITYATRTTRNGVDSKAKPEDGISHDGSGNTVMIGSNVEYARRQEYGIGKMPGKAYMRGALESNREAIKGLFADAIKRKMESLWGGSN